MRKLLLICSAVSLIYGNCVCGMDSDDEMDWEPTAEQEWPVKADKSMTRLERQKRDLQRLHEQFEQNNQSNKPELQELRRNSLVQERQKIFEQGDSRQEVISGSEKMTIADGHRRRRKIAVGRIFKVGRRDIGNQRRFSRIVSNFGRKNTI